ncbi:hypothetical protein [Streptomyces sp. HPF1205]|uniref:hypothetical protein n=1 Tax=Streptomyces sp. HPF1205 TaxID=2873262 RepID=UPI001CEC5723|nr:hypothetical protein [Streptomyces sp. HPF1205]
MNPDFNPRGALLLAVRRIRLLAVLGGLAWVLGVTPPAPVRILLVLVVGVALALDSLADAGLRPARIRLTGWGRPGGDE